MGQAINYFLTFMNLIKCLNFFQGLKVRRIKIYYAELEQEEFSIELKRLRIKKTMGKKYKENKNGIFRKR